MTASTRPMGITILAILAAIAGVLGLLAGLAIVGLGGLMASTGGTGTGIFAGLAGIFGILTLGIGVAYLAFANGAWGLKPWGWILGVILSIVSLVLSGLQALGGDFGGQIVSIVIAGAILYYLNTPAVKQAFGRS